jgi:hypothetical protein
MAEKEYTVVAPDGKEITLIGPVGASQDEIISQAQRLYNPQASADQAVEANQLATAYDRFLNTLSNPQTGGRSGVVGPALVGGAGELVRGAGALTQMAFPETGSRMVEVGEAMTKGAKSVNPVSATGGQIGSYLVPFSGAQKLTSAVGNIPQVAQKIGQIPSFLRATGQQTAIGGSLGYGLTPDEQNREQAGMFGAVTGGAMPTVERGIKAVSNFFRGTSPSQGTMQAAAQGQEAGYVIPPTQVNPSLLNRAIEGTAGKLTTAQNASFRNQQVTNQLAAKSLGLPEDTVITPEVLNNIRTTAGKAYENLGVTGTIKTSPKFNKALDEIGVYKDAKQAEKDFPTGKSSAIVEVVDSLRSPAFDVRSAMSKINVLRNDADMAFKAGDTGLYKANKEAGKILENTIENYLANTKQTDLLNQFRNARQLIAKTYSVGKALNPATGTVEAAKLAQQLRAGKPLSGELKQIGEFSSAFPTATKTTEAMGSLPQISPLDVGGALLAGGGAYLSGSGAETPVTLAALLARPALRSAALSRPVQSRLTQQQSVSPDYSNLARMLMLQGATKAGANEEQK